MKRRSILPFVMTLAACAVLDAPLAQLERWQKQHAQQDFMAIAAEPVVAACSPGTGEACARLHGLKAEACLALAFAARAPGLACPAPGAREAGLLACAADAAQAAEKAAGEIQPAWRMIRGQARLCAIENLPPAMAAPEALSLVQELSPLQDDHGALLRGRAALVAARPGAGSNAARCAAARGAQAEASQGLTLQPNHPALRRLRDDATARAARIANCS